MLRLKEKGIPNGKGKRGDMLVKIDIVFPKKLSHSQKEIIKKLAGEGL
jgi:DnaJ-class molecular chaperone